VIAMSGFDGAAAFQIEAQELLAQLEQALLALERRPADSELINSAFRALHTLKGSGAMFGPPELAGFAHRLESSFEPVRQGGAHATPSLISSLLRGADLLRTMLEQPGEVDREAVDRLTAELAPGPPAAVAGAPGSSSQAEWAIHVELAPTALLFGTNPLMLLDELRALGSCAIAAHCEAVPQLDEIDPTLCYLSWDVRLRSERPRSDIEDVFVFVVDEGNVRIEPVPTVDAAPVAIAGPRQPCEQPVTAAQPANLPDAQLATVRVSAPRLDSLMDRVGELVIAQARLSQHVYRSHDPLLTSITEEIERLATDLRESTMAMRMLPIGSLFGRFRRVVRDLSRELDRSVELTTTGDETELDKTMIDRLVDPLVHLIRNAVDHGIGPTPERLLAGKPAVGRVHLEARQTGAEVLIVISDDGRGIDRDKLRAKAVERGLIDARVDLSAIELDRLIFHPGLSTAERVTNVSGRGVGMDVVKTAIEDLRGSIDVASKPGIGASITLRLPLTLAIIDGLMVRVGEGTFIIPLVSVEECVERSATEQKGSSGRSFLNIRGSLVPFLRLHDLFKFEAPLADDMVVVVRSALGRVGLVVDQVVGHHQTVIKALSRLHRGIAGLGGATILGDGRVALILDVPALIGIVHRPELQRLCA
jgi:two-component system chemotaxis sensor kinase CheA